MNRPTEDGETIVQRQTRQDIAAGLSVLLMFIGAFILPVTAFGFALFGIGTAAMLILMAMSAFGRG